MRKKLYRKSDSKRSLSIPSPNALEAEPYRSPWRRDYARVIHSAAFRRLQGKTQLFPNAESDYFRNRLTHSLEVAQIAKSIAIRVNATDPYFKHHNIDTDLVELAGLTHDLGHPPFGHQGEEALDECMRNHGGFEGNAQTLRILARLENRQTAMGGDDVAVQIDDQGVDQRRGLNLTFRSLASILKYDKKIPHERNGKKSNKVQKGYYYTETELVSQIRQNVLGDRNQHPIKTVECGIMDVADDIAYSTYDLEDAFHAGFLTPLGMISSSDKLLDRICHKVNASVQSKDEYKKIRETMKIACSSIPEILVGLFGSIFRLSRDIKIESEVDPAPAHALIASAAFQSSQDTACNAYYRTMLTSQLVGRFIRGVKCEIEKSCPPLSKIYLDPETFLEVEVLKHFTFESLIASPMLRIVEHRGKAIIKDIFEALTENGHELLPDQFQTLYGHLNDPSQRKRVVCDFIAGMTDGHALEFHDRLFSTNPESIWKPIAWR